MDGMLLAAAISILSENGWQFKSDGRDWKTGWWVKSDSDYSERRGDPGDMGIKALTTIQVCTDIPLQVVCDRRDQLNREERERQVRVRQNN
jgi:hypothetical protein